MKTDKIFPSYKRKTIAYYKNNKPVVAEVIRDENGKLAAVKEFVNLTGENGQKIKGYLTLDDKGREISFYSDKFDKYGKLVDTVLTRVKNDGTTVTIRKKAPVYDTSGVKTIMNTQTLLKDADNKIIAEKARTTVRGIAGIESQIFKFKNKCGRLFMNKTRKTTVLCEFGINKNLKGRIDAIGRTLTGAKELAFSTTSNLAKHLLKVLKK